jgi:hypothetical protein
MKQLNEQFLRMQKLAGIITESQYNKKIQMLNEAITVGETYTASMPTSSDGKERMDIKVKVLGVDRNDANTFIVTPLEDKDYTNPVSKQLNRFEKGKQYGVEAEFIKESLNEDKLVLSNYAKQLYSLFKKAGATPLIVVGKNSTSPDVKNSNISILVTANDELMVGIKGDKATAEKYSNLVAKQFPDLQLKGDIKIGTGWGGEKDSYADLILIPKTTKKGGDINPNQRPNAPKPTV